MGSKARTTAYDPWVAAGEFNFTFRRRVPKLAIQPDTAAIDKTLPVLVLGDIPADVYAYADHIGAPEAAYMETTWHLRLSAALFRLDVDRIVRDLFRGSC